MSLNSYRFQQHYGLTKTMVLNRNCLCKKKVLTQLKIVKKLKLCTLQLQVNTTTVFSSILTFTNNIAYLA